MDQPVVDRRHDTRFLSPLLRLTRATIRPGHVISLIDISASGALLEGHRAMRPGGRVHLQLSTDARTVALNGHVLRCFVSAIDPDLGVVYRGAVRFEHRCDLLWEGGTLAGSHVPVLSRQSTVDAGKPIPDSAGRPRWLTGRYAK